MWPRDLERPPAGPAAKAKGLEKRLSRIIPPTCADEGNYVLKLIESALKTQNKPSF
jgi:hypothetical protein